MKIKQLFLLFTLALGFSSLNLLASQEQHEPQKKRRTAQDDRWELLTKVGVAAAGVLGSAYYLFAPAKSNEITITIGDDQKNKKKESGLSNGTRAGLTLAGLTAAGLLYYFIPKSDSKSN